MKVITFRNGDYVSTYQGVIQIITSPDGKFSMLQQFDRKILCNTFEKDITFVVSM